jgi:hypothetical protein
LSQQGTRPPLRLRQLLLFLHGRGQFRLQPLEHRREGRVIGNQCGDLRQRRLDPRGIDRLVRAVALW